MSRALVRVLVIAVAAGFAAPASAMADAYLVAPQPQIKPLDANGGCSGGATPDATAQSGTFSCTVSWATVASAPSGYAVGNCAYGVHLHRTLKSDLTGTGYYDGGEIFGNYAGCGWIGVNNDVLLNSTSYSNCYPTAGYNLGDFSAYTDGCSGDSGCAGTPRANPGTCNEWANFRPWASGQSPNDNLRDVGANATIQNPDGTTSPRLAWRYVTRYASSSGIPYAMVRDRAVSPGSGNWVFVNAHCMRL